MSDTITAFDQLALSDAVFKSIDEIGYETPSPIQAQIIPYVLAGRDVLGQAQTGTGKTAAFALPILTNIDLSQKEPQALVLAPTRELAIQVAEAFQKYAKFIKGFHVLPIYGGQDYSVQIRGLKRGTHVIVGTPGRVMDHMRKGTLKLNKLKTLVLDEADEMLRMGFIDDVKWVLEQTPPTRQIALFSATMPTQIKRIAEQHLNKPAVIAIKLKTTTAETIRQRFWPVKGFHKLDALTRILEAEEFDGIIIFVRTKTATAELAEKLKARGYAAAPINGDIAQNVRERTIAQLKNGKLDILVATDVAARGLDVPRISHVINYDIPYDTEAYVHRIGRTGRAGKSGEAILFVAPRERRLLGAIEKATRQKIELMQLPSTESINERRVESFKQRITDTLETEDLSFYAELLEQYKNDHDVPPLKIAAALARLTQGDTPLLLQNKPQHSAAGWEQQGGGGDSRGGRRQRGEGKPYDRDRALSRPEKGMQRYRLEVGSKHDVKPGNIVGAIANEASIDSALMGKISIFDDFSTIDLPEGMPKDILKDLKKVWVAGQALNIAPMSANKQSYGAPKTRRGPSKGGRSRGNNKKDFKFKGSQRNKG